MKLSKKEANDLIKVLKVTKSNINTTKVKPKLYIIIR